MATFLDMQNAIADYLLRDDLTSQIKTAINRSIAKYSKTKLWFDETTGTFNSVQGQWSYDTTIIPADIRQIDFLRITVGNIYYHLLQRDIQYIVNANVNGVQGQMIEWAWYNNQIWFYPVPNEAYACELWYQKDYVPLVDPTDTNDWTTIQECQDLIEADALYWLYKKVILDADKAAEYQALARECLQTLNSINESMTGIYGTIWPTWW